jgi:sugar lactone lactonase YvrE
MSLTGQAWAGTDIIVKRNAAQRFIVLPDGVRFPEGITANPQNGDLFVATFDSGPNPNKLLRFDKRGHLLAQIKFGGTPLLGLEFNRADTKVYICNFGASKIQRIAANFTALTAVEDVATIPSIGPPANRTVPNPDTSSDTIIFGSSGFPAPNALTFNKDGDLFISDSQDPLLATTGFPPFGANGLALNSDESKLFIANTGDDRVLRMDMKTKVVDVFTESINGADGVAFDHQGRLWVCANQGDELVALNEAGRVIVKLGDFKGIRKDGTPRGLLFPASLVIVGDNIFVTNLAIPLTPAIGDEPEEDVTRWTIARLLLPDDNDDEDDD